MRNEPSYFLRMKRLRSPGAIRSLRQAIQDRTEAPSRTEVLEDQPHIQALQQFLPQIAAESEQAAKPARVPFLYYRHKRSGRRCSCFLTHTSPDAACQICFGAGFVGGWDLHGCQTEWIDVTHPNIRMVNVIADFKAGTRPILFVLEPGAKKGFIEADVMLYRNIKRVQMLQYIVGAKRKGTQVNLFIKDPTDTNYVPLNDFSLSKRLHNSIITIRAEISRDNNTIPSCKLSHIMIRYKMIPEILMYGDGNLAEESFELGDLGFTDVFSTLNLYVPHSFDHLQNEDFLIRQSDQKRFKVVRFERNVVSEVLLSHTIFARLLIPGTDPLVYYP
jgi:hypothetical protein